MKKYYTNIEEAIKELRETDKVIKIISNKFAIVRCQFTDGKHETERSIMGLDRNKIYYYGYLKTVKSKIDFSESLSNIERTWICYDHSANGKSTHWLNKITDNRRYKKVYRRLGRELIKAGFKLNTYINQPI